MEVFLFFLGLCIFVSKLNFVFQLHLDEALPPDFESIQRQWFLIFFSMLVAHFAGLPHFTGLANFTPMNIICSSTLLPFTLRYLEKAISHTFVSKQRLETLFHPVSLFLFTKASVFILSLSSLLFLLSCVKSPFSVVLCEVSLLFLSKPLFAFS